MMTIKTRWTFAVVVPLLSGIFLYSSASGANPASGSAPATHHLSESQVALRYQAAGSVGAGAGVAKGPKGAVLEAAAPNRASRSFGEQTALVPLFEDVGEPTGIPVNALLAENERLAPSNVGRRTVVWEDFEPSAYIYGLALLAFVLYSRRRADN